MSIRTFVLAIAMFAVAPAAAGAQSTYAPTGDTLRYREVITMQLASRSPQGETPVSIEQEATLAIVLFPVDTAHAWFEAFRFAHTIPEGRQTPPTGSMLKKPYRLKFDPRGRTEEISVPVFPQNVGAVDPTQQFADFFPRLPATPLRLGLVWTDTATRNMTNGDKTMATRLVASYVVERDTVVAGEPAFVIGIRQQTTYATDVGVPGRAMRVGFTNSGSDNGFVVFSKAGRMLSRQRFVSVTGRTTITGGDAGTVETTQTGTFMARVELVK